MKDRDIELTLDHPELDLRAHCPGDNAERANIRYHLYVLEKVKCGIERADDESAVSHGDAKARLSKWLAS
jgi:hypothetical protein